MFGSKRDLMQLHKERVNPNNRFFRVCVLLLDMQQLASAFFDSVGVCACDLLNLFVTIFIGNEMDVRLQTRFNARPEEACGGRIIDPFFLLLDMHLTLYF